MIYLDNAATTQPFPELLTTDFLGAMPWANPSSPHAAGLATRAALDRARTCLAQALGVKGGAVLFCSGGTEANRMAVLGPALGPPRPGNIVLNQLEHSSVRNLAAWAALAAFEVRWAQHDAHGTLHPEAVASLVDRETILVSVHAVNGELGTVQPLADLARAVRARKKSVLLHVDAVQGFLRVPLLPEEWGLDLVSVSAHKVHGLKGVGALWVRNLERLNPVFPGGSHESGKRPGTENVPGILAFARAVELYRAACPSPEAHFGPLRRALVEGLVARVPGVTFNGGPRVSPHLVSANFPGVRSEMLIHEMDSRGLCASAGAACSAARPGPSEILRAVGVKDDVGTVRLSLGLFNTLDDVQAVVTALSELVPALREVSR
jgi:cysteine desulfurase